MTMSEWISAEERMPEDGGIGYSNTVLLYSPHDGVLVGYLDTQTYAEPTWREYDGWAISWPVTHWQPLPDPPEDDQ